MLSAHDMYVWQIELFGSRGRRAGAHVEVRPGAEVHLRAREDEAPCSCLPGAVGGDHGLAAVVGDDRVVLALVERGHRDRPRERAGAGRVVRGRQRRSARRLRAGDAPEVDGGHRRDHVGGLAGEHVGHAAAVGASAGVDALGIDAGVGLEPLDHVPRELDVVDLVLLGALAAVAHVPAVVGVGGRVGKDGDAAHAVALGAPPRR